MGETSSDENDAPSKTCEWCGDDMSGYLLGRNRLPIYPHYNECKNARADLRGDSPERRRRLYLEMIRQAAHLPESSDFRFDLEEYAAEPSHRIGEENRRAYEMCLRFRNFCRSERRVPGQGFAIQGNLGAGKTILAVALARSILKIGVRVYWLNLPDLRDRLASGAADGAYGEWRARLAEGDKVQVLFLDEAGQEMATEKWVTEFLAPLFRERHENHLPVILTTIYPVTRLHTQWSLDGGKAKDAAGTIMERLKSRCMFVQVKGESRRAQEAEFDREEYA